MHELVCYFVCRGMADESVANIYLWNVEQLRNFLKCRKIPCSSASKAALQRQVHFAIQFGFQSRIDDKTVSDSVQQKLILENGLLRLPAPKTIDNWEVNSYNMPPLTDKFVESYFNKVNKSFGVSANECKALALGKGLVLSGHADVLLYHPISQSINYCFIKTYVVRQTNTREPPHAVWAILQKDSGAVHQAYCTCAGGVGGSCKHVAALLYMVLSFHAKGSHVTCTSKPQKWGKPGRFHEPDFVRNVPLKKLKKNCDIEEIEPKPKRFSFDPRAPEDRDDNSDITQSCFDLNVLREITNGNAAVLHSLSIRQTSTVDVASDLNIASEETVYGATIPASITEIADAIKQDRTLDFESFEYKLKEQMEVSAEEADSLEKATRKQADSSLWHEHRRGRITGSKVKETILKVGPNMSVSSKISSTMKSVMGYNKPFRSKQTDYGNAHEGIACKRAYTLLKSSHSNLTMSVCGMYISQEYVHISSTPDRMLHCTCCGVRPLEVKNPYTYRHLSVSEYSKIPGQCLICDNDTVALDRSHPYYYQVQCHMLVTGCRSAVFCVRLNHKHGLFVEEILYDDMVDCCKPGDNIEITGIFRAQPIRVTKNKTIA